MPKIGNKTIAYRIYAELNGRDTVIADTTDCTLPSVENMSDSVKGAGILGEIDWPSLAQPGAMSFAFSGRILNRDAVQLAAPKAHKITVRWAVEKINTASVSSVIEKHKMVMLCVPKKFEPGKIESGSAMDSSSEFEVVYIKHTVDGRETFEIDKLNNVYKIAGVNYAKAIEDAL